MELSLLVCFSLGANLTGADPGLTLTGVFSLPFHGPMMPTTLLLLGLLDLPGGKAPAA